jgi:hypothetical protein
MTWERFLRRVIVTDDPYWRTEQDTPMHTALGLGQGRLGHADWLWVRRRLTSIADGQRFEAARTHLTAFAHFRRVAAMFPA